MVDMLVLVMTLGMLAIVVFFALRFDRTLPWFERVRPPGKSPSRTEPGKTARATRPSRFPVRR